jgi:carbonic anhydrase
MSSIIFAVYELNAKEILVIGHHDCGMIGLNASRVLEKAQQRGVSTEMIETLRHAGIDMDRFLRGFDDVHDSVMSSVKLIRNHPLLPKNLAVHGLIIHPETGMLDLIDSGYEWANTP